LFQLVDGAVQGGDEVGDHAATFWCVVVSSKRLGFACTL
jgi:hypothetical protein